MNETTEPASLARRGWIAAAVAVSLALLAAEPLTPLGFAHGTLQAAAVALAVRSGSARAVIGVGALAALAAALGAALSPPELTGAPVIGNRLTSVAVVGLVALLGLLFLRESGRLKEGARAASRRAARLDETVRLDAAAGRLGGFGRWRLDPADMRIDWSAPVAGLFGMAVDSRPGLDDIIAFALPEHRGPARAAVLACLHDGAPFDIEAEIENTAGERRRVRVVGEAGRDARGRVAELHGAFQDITPLHRAEAERDTLRERLNIALEMMSDAFLLVDPDGRLIYVNAAAERLADLPRQAMLGRNPEDAFGELGESEAASACRRARETDHPALFEFDHAGRRLLGRAHPSRIGLAIHLRDVTREREGDARLRLLESALSRINDMVLITDAASLDDPHPRILWANAAFERITGWRAAEVIGRSPRFLQGPETHRPTLDRLRAQLEARTPVRAELVNYTRAGQPFWVEIDITPLRDAKGDVTHFVSVQRDVTARKRAEMELAQSEERFRLFASATEDAVWDWDLDADVLWWNEKVETLFHLDRRRMSDGAARWEERLHPDDRDRVVAALDALIADRANDLWHDEYRIRRGDGAYAVVRARGRALRDAEGRAVRMLGSMHDITEQREAERQLAAAQRMETVARLGGGIAHDFNNLFTVLVGNAEMLDERLRDDPKLARLARITRQAAERGADLTDRLLAFARRQPLHPRRVDVGRLISGMEPLLRSLFAEDVEMRLDFAPDLPEVVLDPALLENSVLNLCLNARDAMPEGGRLWISAGPAEPDAELQATGLAGPLLRVAVQETGVGMDPETAARAFEPFFTTKEVGKGTGLGLSMVHGFVKQSGGHARLRSTPGEGTVVELFLPVAEHAGAAPVPAENAVEPLPETEKEKEKETAGRRVLVVEDDELVRQHVSGLLQGMGWEVQAARDADEALAILSGDQGFDLLFTDVVMPGRMSGLRLARAAARIAPELPVLFTSGYSERAAEADGLPDGARLLHKPYRSAELAQALEDALRGSPAPSRS